MRYLRAALLTVAISVLATSALAQQDHPLLSPGNGRDGFIEKANSDCNSRTDDASRKILGEDGWHNYCKCVGPRLADSMTSDDLRDALADRPQSNALTARTDEIMKACKEAILAQQDQSHQQDHPFSAPSADRDSYVSSFVMNCTTSANKSATIKLLGENGVAGYCKCLAEKAADAATTEEVIYEIKNNGPSESFKAMVMPMAQVCMKANLK